MLLQMWLPTLWKLDTAPWVTYSTWEAEHSCRVNVVASGKAHDIAQARVPSTGQPALIQDAALLRSDDGAGS